MFENIVVEVGVLIGFSALVSLIVNVLKFFGVVQDGTADKWVASFNLLGVLALFATRLFIPGFDPVPVDSVMGQIASVGVYIMSFVVMIFGSKLTYVAVKGLPIIGKSNSETVK